MKNGKFANFRISMSTLENTILGLKLPSDPRWVNLAEISLEDILSDHAYCEQKAASHCISLIQKYPEYTKLVDELCPIVTEEWGHFRMVLAEMRKRNLRLGPQRKDDYVNALNTLETKGGRPETRFMDRLLIFALIEARSCERFRLLSEGLTDEYLRDFYRKFMISEAGHYRLFIDLANEYCDEAIVQKRWHELLEAEKEIIANLEVRGDRIH
jgi:tRNA-(ms[2]io[6]A)-hydroxylase